MLDVRKAFDNKNISYDHVNGPFRRRRVASVIVPSYNVNESALNREKTHCTDVLCSQEKIVKYN